jgi:hypothetical protein
MDFGSHVGPEETLADAVKSFVAAEVGGRRAGVVGVEDGFTEGFGNNNERHRVRGWKQSLVHAEVGVVERNSIGSEVGVVGMVDGFDQIFRPVSSGVVLEMGQKFGEIGVGAIGREPSSSVGRCAGKQAADSGGCMIGA